ncbi:MAG TPA: hypothetical protein VME41_14110 [Stellaceae bacterium]|nr:hypothetical protein [Stellaceae bacterium]
MPPEYLKGRPKDIVAYHQHHAAHLRAVAAAITTRRLRVRLLQEAEQHDLLAEDIIVSQD